MSRLIDADVLSDQMYHEAFETDTEMQRWDSGCWIRYKMFENALRNAPTIEERKTSRWIPVTERLPEEDGEYLCDYNGHLHIGQVINKHFRHYGEIADHLITAWMPLPEPYKERREE